jgi:membrane fusion protein, copper/silver efflux system
MAGRLPWSRTVATAAVLLMGLAAAGYWLPRVASEPHEDGGGATLRYQCSMHPQVIAAAPGQCPICGMNLTSVEPEPEERPAGRAPLHYQCSMHPQVIADVPGQCPICGMNLTSVGPEPDRPQAGGADSPVHAALELSPTRQQLIGVKTEPIEYRELSRRVRTAGTVAYDPELYALLSDYRAVLRIARNSPAPSDDSRAAAEARNRSLALALRRLGISRGQLDALFRAGDDPVTLLLPGQNAWIYGRVYAPELDLPRADYGVSVTSPSSPGRTFRGRVVTVDSTVDPIAEGVRVRAVVATPGGGLRPGLRVHLTIEVPLGRHLALPGRAARPRPTRRSSSTRAGTAAPTSSRTRSPTRSSRRCSARRRCGGARLLGLRLLVRLRHLRGRHRHLLGAHADARVPLGVLRACPRACQDRAGPDATGLGWVFQYALVDTSGKHSLATCAPTRTGTCATT